MKTINSVIKSAIIIAFLGCLPIFSASAGLSGQSDGWGGDNSGGIFGDGSAPAQPPRSTESSFNPFASDPSGPLRAKPGDGTGQKEEVPVQSGLWAMIGLAMAYGVFRRKGGGKENMSVKEKIE